MARDIRNQQFRDMTAQARHPFQATATMTNGDVALPDDFLLDAIIYLPSGLQPFYLSSLEVKTDGMLQAAVADATGVELAWALIVDSEWGYSHLVDGNGLVVGTLVYASDAATRIGAALNGVKATFTSEQTPFQPGVCFTSGAGTGVHAFNLDGVDYKEGAALIARTGVVIDSTAGAVRLSIYGEEDFRVYVRSVNGVAPSSHHLWMEPRHMAGHTVGAANVRTSNDRGVVRVARSSDFSYGDKVLGD